MQLPQTEVLDLPQRGAGQVGDEHDIAALAHSLWQARGCPEGSPEQDWFRAAEELRTRACEGVSPHATHGSTEPLT